MQHFATYVLWALSACTVWRGSLQEDLPSDFVCLLDDQQPNNCDSFCLTELQPLLNRVVTAQEQGSTSDAKKDIIAKLDKLEGKIKDVQAKLEGKLQAVQAKVEAKLKENLIAVQSKLEDQHTLLTWVMNSQEYVKLRLSAIEIRVNRLGRKC